MSADRRRKTGPAPGARRHARELALAALYRADLVGLSAAGTIEILAETLTLSLEDWPEQDRRAVELREEALAYATQVVAGVFRERPRIDETIEALSIGWPLERLAAMDRTILRIGLWELLEATAAPAVVINEAVELAREYGSADSAKFVNGILGAWVRKA
jgi:N utilization substance protein B